MVMQPVLRCTFEVAYVDTNAKVSGETGKLTAPIKREVLPVGEAYQAFTRRATAGHSFEDDDKAEAARLAAENANGTSDVVDADAVEDEPEGPELAKLDPKDWKNQDHYAVLGLSKLRYQATPGQINYAHRRKVLKHHPDKKAKLGGDSNDDAFFKCISKAMDTLSNPEKRRLFDSVDQGVDDSYPETAVPDNEFIDAWAPVFERESRFNDKKGPAPALGKLDAPKAEVERFYDFWYNFDSWRSFDYLDKETNEGSDSRDEKRYAERKNKAERARRKKEDNTRLRMLVDTALGQDPRIRRYKQEEKAARDAKKKGKAAVSPAQQKAEEEAKRKADEEAAKAEQAAKDASEKADRDAAKKQREALKKNLKREKKVIREAVIKANYFAPASAGIDPAVVESVLAETERILDALEPDEVALLRQDVDAASSGEQVRAALVKNGETVKERGVVLATLV